MLLNCLFLTKYEEGSTRFDVAMNDESFLYLVKFRENAVKHKLDKEGEAALSKNKSDQSLDFGNEPERKDAILSKLSRVDVRSTLTKGNSELRKSMMLRPRSRSKTRAGSRSGTNKSILTF